MNAELTSPDAQLIDQLGGPTKVAELLGYDKASGGVQRVHNWLQRGIPPKVKLERPDIFLREQITQLEDPTPTEKTA